VVLWVSDYSLRPPKSPQDGREDDGLKMIPVEEAQKIILREIKEVGLERVGLLQSLSRILSEEVISQRDLPPWDNSSMDGFAVRWEDVQGVSRTTPKNLKIIEEIPAGTLPKKRVVQGTAAQIMTGAPLPEGADAVVMVEETRRQGDEVCIFESVQEGENVRKRGENIRKGEMVLGRGTLLRPAGIGMLASLGRSFLTVFRVPQVAILATGNELVEVDEAVTSEKIINSNSYSLAAQIQECGANYRLLGIARDTQEDVVSKLSRGLDADFILVSGGVSVGSYDFVKQASQSLGADLKFWKVALKPGAPLAFGVLQGKPFFGLPGNPVSSMVTFELFVRPALLKMMGFPSWFRPQLEVVVEKDLSKDMGKAYLIRVMVERVGDQYVATPTGEQGSGILMSMVKANGLLILSEKQQKVSAGEKCRVLLLDQHIPVRKN